MAACTNTLGGAKTGRSTTEAPAYMEASTLITRPCTWKSGSTLTQTSCGLRRSVFCTISSPAKRVECVSTTVFCIPVVPLVRSSTHAPGGNCAFVSVGDSAVLVDGGGGGVDGAGGGAGGEVLCCADFGNVVTDRALDSGHDKVKRAAWDDWGQPSSNVARRRCCSGSMITAMGQYSST